MWLSVLAAIAALLLAVFTRWVRITIEYSDGGGLRVLLGIGFVRLILYPRKEKKPRAKDYTVAALKKREAKKKRAEEKKAARKAKKDEAKKSKKTAAGESKKKKSAKGRKFSDITALVRQILRIVKIFVTRFGGGFYLDIKRLYIKIATDDAAATAVTYGAVSQGVSYLLALLDRFDRRRHVVIKRRENVYVGVDFLADKFSADISITLRIRISRIFSSAFAAAIEAAKIFILKNDGAKNQSAK